MSTPGPVAQSEPIQLVAYVTSDARGWEILPAPRERAWMEATPGRFAYRCLPLVMANQAGWVVPCPVSFTARAVASEDPHTALEITFDEEPQRWGKFISSHFGSGVLTFSLPWLFRTSLPMMLRVSGLPNFFVPGAWALEGLVETSWSPYTFTMNWMLEQSRGRRPGAPARFSKGDPICFIQPLDVGLIEGAMPRVCSIDEDPALKEEFAAWAKARLTFNADADRGAAWQRNYFQGRHMDGREEEEHRARVEVPKFEEAKRRRDEETK